MKKPISHSLVNRKLFLVLLFLICSSIAKAQWTFTFQLTQSGPCPTGVTLPVINVPNLGLPTQAMCESLRQQILAISQSMPIYKEGKYIGECRLYYTCTTCTGSDLVAPGQSTGQGITGEVSINGLMEGKSLFTSHQSQAFEDWATSYKQLLASYGITSVMDKDFIVPKTALTEDKYFNAQYTNLLASFNPKVAPAGTPKTEQKSTEDDEFPSITMPIMGGSPMTQEDRERQNLPTKGQYIDMMTYVSQGSGIEESTPATTDLSESATFKRVDAFFDEMGDWPGGKAPAAAGKLLLSTVNESDKLIRDMTLNNKYSEEELAEMNPVKVIVNNVATEMITNKIKDTVKEVKQDLGLNYLGSKFGEATKAGAEVGLKLMDKAATLKTMWTGE